MKKGLGKRLIVFALAAAFFAQMVNTPVHASAATSKVTVSTQEGLTKAIKDPTKETINLRSKVQQTFTMRSEDCETKTLNANTVDTTIKNAANFNIIRLWGSNNTFYNYVDIPCISMYATDSNLMVMKGTIATLKLKGDLNKLKVYENATVNKLFMDKVNANFNIIVNGKANAMYLKQTSSLDLSGTAKKAILRSYGKDSMITSSIPVVAKFYQDAEIILTKGSEGSILKVDKDAMIKAINQTEKAVIIQTATGKITVEPGKTMNSTGKEDAKEDTKEDTEKDDNVFPGFIGDFGGVTGGVSGGTSGGGGTTPSISLSKIELDSDSATLVNSESETSTVTISTYKTDEEKINGITSNSQVGIRLVSTTLAEEYNLSDETVKSNSKKYYTVNKDKVTFLSNQLMAGNYVYEIAVGGCTKTFTVTITGEIPMEAETLFLPYMTADSTKPIESCTIDCVVNTEADAHKNVSFGFFAKVGDYYKLLPCADYKFGIYDSNGISLASGAKGSFLDGGTEKNVSLDITSINSQVVKKIATGDYTVVMTINESGSPVTKTCKLKVVDSQKKVSISQYTNTVAKEWISYAEHSTASDDALLIQYYNDAIAINSNYRKVTDSGNAYTLIKEAGGETAWNTTLNGFYLQYGIERSCKVTYDGKTYFAYDPRIAFKSGVVGQITSGSGDKVMSTTDTYPNPIQSATIGKLTVYLDVANTGASGEYSRLFVPFTFDNARISFNFVDSTITDARFLIGLYHTNFDKQTDIRYLPIGTDYKLYLKFLDKDQSEIRNYSNYEVISVNPEIVTTSNFSSSENSVNLEPVSSGTATLKVRNATTKEVVKSVQIHVGKLDASKYQLKLGQNNVILSNSSVTDTKTVTMQLFNQATRQEDTTWIPFAKPESIQLKLVSGEDADLQELNSDSIEAIQALIDQDLYNASSLSAANIVFMNGRNLTFKGNSSCPLPVGTYHFVITSHGITAALTVQIKDAATEGVVTYNLIQDSMVVNLSTYDYTKSLENAPLNIKVVKKMNGNAVAYAEITNVKFGVDELNDYYSQEYGELYVVKTTPLDEYRYCIQEIIPALSTTFTVTYLDENGEEQQLSGTIQTTGSYPDTVVSNYTTWNTLTLKDELQAYIWNTLEDLSVERQQSFDEQLEILAVNKAVKLVDNKGLSVGGYDWPSYDCNIEKEEDTGVIKSITLTNLCYQQTLGWATINSYHGNNVEVILPDCTADGPFKLTFVNNGSGN